MGSWACQPIHRNATDRLLERLDLPLKCEPPRHFDVYSQYSLTTIPERPRLVHDYRHPSLRRLVLSCALAAAAILTFTRCSSSTGPDVELKSAVPTYHYDNQRSGIQSKETILTPANVNATSFGKQFTLKVDGQVFAQPLIATNVIMADGNAHDLVLIATEHDTVYAFDADTASTQPFWSTSLLQTGETTVPAAETGSKDIQPEIGITSTPVFDPNQNILYVVSKSKLVQNGQTSYFQRLHALKVETGAEALNGPTVITASVPGSAPDAVNGQVPFNALKSLQRSALALIDGNVWVAFASHGDNSPIMAGCLVTRLQMYRNRRMLSTTRRMVAKVESGWARMDPPRMERETSFSLAATGALIALNRITVRVHCG